MLPLTPFPIRATEFQLLQVIIPHSVLLGLAGTNTSRNGPRLGQRKPCAVVAPLEPTLGCTDSTSLARAHSNTPRPPVILDLKQNLPIWTTWPRLL